VINAALNGSNGFYKAVIEEEQSPFLRIEADGYQTMETAIHLTRAFPLNI
jgi:hypothetical protein